MKHGTVVGPRPILSPDVSVQLETMIEAIGRALAYTRGMDRATLFADRKTVDAVVRNVEVLARGAKQVPNDLRARHREIEWARLIVLGDMLGQACSPIDDDVLWDAVARRLPMLLPLLEECLAPAGRR